ncbi:hypothetical protein [Bacillus sp. 165]|uniref:hypothetical protein n=1 Tax=Bacillus sp. 165 TaxID=1529117 RepID=UPI001ADA8F90|nr:hypothetical protein [Bacillus sp. 165]MBO9129542.1 hypothetical protein [Bacillus sp. 165]
MFDPTVFDNLKVIVEGYIYDQDFDGAILVTGRKDLVDLASMNRQYRVSFVLKNLHNIHITAVFVLQADTRNLLGEIMEDASFTPGCTAEILFQYKTVNPETDCSETGQLLKSVWGEERIITQQVAYEHGKQDYSVEASVQFQKHITEDHIDDLPVLVDHMIETMHKLTHMHEKRS